MKRERVLEKNVEQLNLRLSFLLKLIVAKDFLEDENIYNGVEKEIFLFVNRPTNK
jgi:hypothetical protein